jgi:spore maturation protein CgeB
VNEELPFAEVHARFFANRPRPPVYGKCISSRHFDAIGTKTCQIMLRGRYNDVLEPDRDYIALDADFANLADALGRFRDESYRQVMVDRAHERVLAAHTYRHRIERVVDAVAAL